MKNILFVFIIFWSSSCSKDAVNQYPQGIYVEETLRLDTIDFTLNNRIDATELAFEFNSRPFPDPANLGGTVYNSGTYTFQILNNQSINLRNWFSSSSVFNNYYFNWVKENPYFEIEKFYNRPNLFGRLKFVKL